MKFVTAIAAALVSSCFATDLKDAKDTLAPCTDKIFFDIEIASKSEGRVVMCMFGDTTPKTVKNFVELSDGTNPIGSAGKPLTYKGSTFHRIIDNFMAQGGDITQGNGMGGDSIYGPNFADENFNLSQFFITYINTTWLNGKHVVFGEVIEGKDVVDKMVGHSNQVVIADCGKL